MSIDDLSYPVMVGNENHDTSQRHKSYWSQRRIADKAVEIHRIAISPTTWDHVRERADRNLHVRVKQRVKSPEHWLGKNVFHRT